MKGGITRVARQALRAMLRPVVKFCIEHSITIQEIEELVRSELVNITKQQLKERGAKVSIAKVAALIGLHRREVSRFFKNEGEDFSRIGISSRVISTWIYDQAYRTSSGSPRELSFDGSSSEFHRLVKSVAPEASPKGLLEHFLTCGILTKTDSNKVIPVKSGYAPDNEPAEFFKMLELDLDEIIPAISENAFRTPQNPNLHHTTEYTELNAKHYEEVRGWLLDQGSTFHNTVRQYLAKFDTSVERQPGKTNQKTMKVFFTTVSHTKRDLVTSKKEEE